MANQYELALLFTGHRIDVAGRDKPRFPAWAEGRVREAIRAAVADALRGHAQVATTIGLAAAASGGDLLFHEVCAELGITTRVLLAMPAGEFVAESVADAGCAWVERFHALLDRVGPGNVLFMGAGDGLLEGATGNVWQRANLWMIEQAVALAPERTLISLWDGKAGDGPGGTQHFVNIAAQFGVRVAEPIAMEQMVAGD